MRYILNIRVMIAVHLILAAALLSLFAYLTNLERDTLSHELHTRIDEQETLLLQLAELTDRNAATEDITSIVRDCADRTRFDELLGSLGTLGPRELLTTQQLFDACGGYFARQKALMVAKLEREHASLSSYIELLSTLEDPVPEKRHAADIAELISREKDRSRLLNELVTIQRDIITALIQGSSIQSDEVGERVAHAEDVSQSLAVLDVQIDTIRERISE